jgi:hypothetical protein
MEQIGRGRTEDPILFQNLLGSTKQSQRAEIEKRDIQSTKLEC